MKQSLQTKRRVVVSTSILAAGLMLATFGCGGSNSASSGESLLDASASAQYVVLGYNDLGMHCMNDDFSEICVLPPANTLRAQVFKKGEEPDIVTSGVTLNYSIPGNTKSSNKTNFWKYAKPLFGSTLAQDMGLFGFGLAGTMKATKEKDFMAQGIPITPITDAGKEDPYQLSKIDLKVKGQLKASTQAVVPVSWEMACNKCHTTPGVSVATDILQKHDRKHGTQLVKEKPVLCAKCHGDAALGAPGKPGVSTLSSAMHLSHSKRMTGMSAAQACYSCHPGEKTQCFRDVHKTKGMTCNSCHTSMEAVGSPSRRPWVDEPRCGSCHKVAGHEYEQPGKLYKDSVGHNGVKCTSCHGSPHAITPTEQPNDNVQAIALQGSPGVIKKCTVCHTKTPSKRFNHSRDD